MNFSLKKRLILAVMQTQSYEYLLKNVIPYIRFTSYYTTMRGWKYHQVYNRIRPGHIILTVDRKKLTTRLIPGEFAHAAVCVSKDTGFEVAEMTHTDYTKSCVSDLCYEADRVVILEGTRFGDLYTEKFIQNVRKFDGVPYDVEFTLGVKALSCAELVWAADEENRLGISIEDIAGLGKPYVSPSGIYKADNVRVVLDTDDL